MHGSIDRSTEQSIGWARTRSIDRPPTTHRRELGRNVIAQTREGGSICHRTNGLGFDQAATKRASTTTARRIDRPIDRSVARPAQKSARLRATNRATQARVPKRSSHATRFTRGRDRSPILSLSSPLFFALRDSNRRGAHWAALRYPPYAGTRTRSSSRSITSLGVDSALPAFFCASTRAKVDRPIDSSTELSTRLPIDRSVGGSASRSIDRCSRCSPRLIDTVDRSIDRSGPCPFLRQRASPS